MGNVVPVRSFLLYFSMMDASDFSLTVVRLLLFFDIKMLHFSPTLVIAEDFVSTFVVVIENLLAFVEDMFTTICFVKVRSHVILLLFP